MKIQSITSLYNPFKLKNINTKSENYNSNPISSKLAVLDRDVVSFSAKKYDIEQIVNPTNHCAYCGCKVYSEAQIDSLAKSMLQGKSHRLQGDIKSVLEKLDTAVRSEELTFAKKVENSNEIDFFKKFLQISTDKSFLKGEAIFEQVYGMESEEAFETLKRNMRPLTRTVDHVSPQNLDEENNNSDVNLVEACYCCNHDLKKGASFAEFYAMFPSIKENMPAEKFHYAHSNLMASASASILSRMSATNLLKHVQRLFGQREEAISRLGSIDFRIFEANASIDDSIKACETEIAEKQEEKSALQTKLDILSNDDEYNALIKRNQLIQQQDQQDAVLTSLRERRTGVSNSLNELRNPAKKQKKQTKVQMSKEEKEAKIASLKQTISDLNTEINLQQDKRDDIELQIMELDSQYPTVEMLQSLKTKADNLCASHVQLQRETANLQQLELSTSSLSTTIQGLETAISQYPQDDFCLETYSQEEQEQYSRYNLLVEAAKFIEGHSTGGGLKTLINIAAKQNILDEIATLEKTDIVKNSNDYLARKELQSKLESTKKQKTDVDNQINAARKKISSLKTATAAKTLEEAQDESAKYSSDIKRLTEKQSYLKLPQKIATLAAELLLLKNTIEDLQAKKQEIANINTPQA